MKMDAYPGLKSINNPLSNNLGQLAIESVLLLTVLIGAFLFATNYAREKKIISNLVEKPMQSVAIMTAYGVWKSPDGAGCKVPGGSSVSLGKCHPNSIARALSSAPVQ